MAPLDDTAANPRRLLANAIEVVKALEAEHADIVAARTKVRSASEFLPDLRAAEKALAEAQEHEPHRLVDEAMGRPSSGLPSVADAQASLDALGRDQVRARETHRLLTVELDAIEHRLEIARMTRKDAVAVAVAGSDAVAQLLASLTAARASVDRLEGIARALGQLGGLPPGALSWDRETALSAPGNVAAAARWRAAVTALETDPSVPLPGDGDL